MIRRALDAVRRRLPRASPGAAGYERFDPTPEAAPDLRGPDGAPVPRLLRLDSQWVAAGDAAWRRALAGLAPLHHKSAVLFDGFVEATFRADPEAEHRKPWVGVLHGEGSLEDLLGNPRFALSAKSCAGLFVFSDALREALAERFAFPVSRLPRPEDPDAFARAVAASAVYAALRRSPVPNFLLFAHSRTGSTTLQRILETHPDIRMLSEPFNPMVPKRNPMGRYAYLYDSEDPETLERCLDEMFHHYTGVRHLMPGRPPEGRVKRWDIEALNRCILRRPLRRILLTRRNRLQSVVSVMMSQQTRVWQRSQGQHERSFEPLDVAEVERLAGWLRDDVEQYRRFMAESGLAFLDLAYEDLFGTGVGEAEQLAQIRGVFAHLGAPDPDEAVWRSIRELLDPARNKLNTDDTYRRIPNAGEIEARLAAEHGHLFIA